MRALRAAGRRTLPVRQSRRSLRLLMAVGLVATAIEIEIEIEIETGTGTGTGTEIGAAIETGFVAAQLWAVSLRCNRAIRRNDLPVQVARVQLPGRLVPLANGMQKVIRYCCPRCPVSLPLPAASWKQFINRSGANAGPASILVYPALCTFAVDWVCISALWLVGST